MQHTRWHKFVEVTERIAAMPDFDETGPQKHLKSWQNKARNIGTELRAEIPIFRYTPERDGQGLIYSCPDEIFAMPTELNPVPFERFIVETWTDLGETIFATVVSNGSKIGVVGFILNGSQTVTCLIGSTVGEIDWNAEAVSWTVQVPELVDYCSETFGCAMNMVRSTILQCATKGIVQERIEAPKSLNKQRVRKGRAPIPTVIYMRPGHYYDRDGKQHNYDARKPVAIHWRRGHIRNVWCGTGDERRREPRYISPCLVNYDGGDTPEHKVRVLR